MIKIYTSYFGNAKKVQAAGVLRVAICIGLPRYGGYDTAYQLLAPTRAMIQKHVSQEEYDVKFDAILAALDPAKVIADLEEIAKNAGAKEIAIMCYEKPGDFCHRHVVANWLNKSGLRESPELRIVEFGFSPAQKRQQSLFDRVKDI